MDVATLQPDRSNSEDSGGPQQQQQPSTSLEAPLFPPSLQTGAKRFSQEANTGIGEGDVLHGDGGRAVLMMLVTV